MGPHLHLVNDERAATRGYPDSKVHGAKMGPTWVLPAPDGPYVGPMNLAIRLVYTQGCYMREI